MGRKGVTLSANFAQACVCLGVGCHSLHAHYRLVYAILKIPANNVKQLKLKLLIHIRIHVRFWIPISGSRCSKCTLILKKIQFEHQNKV
jgi:hypothetical protein